MEPNVIPFSVVIPTHNGRSSITRSVASVLAQSHRKLELVVVCDGDGTRTSELLTMVSDARLRIVEQPRSGVSAARNLGVSVATHDWVTFLDDDDCARPHWLAAWAESIRADTLVVTGRLVFWEGDESRHIAGLPVVRDRPDDGRQQHSPGRLRHAEATFSRRSRVRRVLDVLREPGPRAPTPGPPYGVGRPGGVVHVPHCPRRLPPGGCLETRVRRYRSAPADSARVFLSRYESPAGADPRATASLLRIISRSDRHEHQFRAAISASTRACRLQPLNWANYKCLVLALLSALSNSVTGIARGRENSE